MSVTKVGDLHESATALDMIGDRTKSIQRKKKGACSQIAALNGRAKQFTGWECRRPSFSGKKDSQSAIKIGAHYILRNNTETKAHFFCLS